MHWSWKPARVCSPSRVRIPPSPPYSWESIKWGVSWLPQRRVWTPTITTSCFKVFIMRIATIAMPFTNSFTLIWKLFYFFPVMHVILCNSGCWYYKKDNDYEFLHFWFSVFRLLNVFSNNYIYSICSIRTYRSFFDLKPDI